MHATTPDVITRRLCPPYARKC